MIRKNVSLKEDPFFYIWFNIFNILFLFPQILYNDFRFYK